MPIISGDYLTVLNLFRTDAAEKQDRLIAAMREIVDAAAYPGWISSTVHSGIEKFGTANFIQWRSGEDLEARYAGDEFKHRTMPLFSEITTNINLLQNEVAFSRPHPSQGELVEIGPHRDDFTVIEVFGVADDNPDELVGVLADAYDWLVDVPGYRSHTVLRGLRSRLRQGQGAWVVNYSQWSDGETFWAYRNVPKDEQSEERRKTFSRMKELVTSCDWNTYRVVHTRSAAQ
ncbi:MAG TPA: antibiotic biosynthesis monooxygenase [Actinophytocola sp.]|uniref:antibiotic biosynthesis monooxygenase n=1 Tax=Actinophytocola sp. TaxID=1872138 RepID=UPI002DDCE6C7|nr:antibiotic biosynthesis monooxygenase [Actinophytocola sp.]HEV2780626.1 antibiotic biosynthesis monooxygenase [Actinophytocola sp.]